MRKIGFVASPTPGPDDRKLVIEVRELKYQSLKQTLTFATEVSVSLVAMATTATSTTTASTTRASRRPAR